MKNKNQKDSGFKKVNSFKDLGFDYLLRLLGLPHPPFLSCTNKD
jgi:hypothetical protein